MKRLLGATAALVVGSVLGAIVTIAVQSRGLVPREKGPPDPVRGQPVLTPIRQSTFLAWVPGGLPDGFGAAAASLPKIGAVAVVAEDNTWMTRSFAADGSVADRPPSPFMIPIDAAAVTPRSFAPFLPPAEVGLSRQLARGRGILGATSAELRGLGPGSTLQFAGGVRIEIAAVLPDELIGAAELLVSRETGARIGITHERYLLLQPARSPTSAKLIRQLTPLLPSTLDPVYRKVQVRAPGETPYFRAGDAVLPPVLLKSLFGEFSARPDPANPGFLQVDPSWVRANIVTTTVPVLGRVTCNRALIPQLRGAMQELQREGLASLMDTYYGCYVPRFVNRVPTATISHHTWGIAFDCNLAGNGFGNTPHQDPRLVTLLAKWGFTWGGDWVVPDGNHFEYRRPPEP